MPKIRLWYWVSDAGDGSCDVNICKSKEQMEAAIAAEEEEYGHTLETNGSFEDIDINEFEVVG
jgi:hypothetical protein